MNFISNWIFGKEEDNEIIDEEIDYTEINEYKIIYSQNIIPNIEINAYRFIMKNVFLELLRSKNNEIFNKVIIDLKNQINKKEKSKKDVFILNIQKMKDFSYPISNLKNSLQIKESKKIINTPIYNPYKPRIRTTKKNIYNIQQPKKYSIRKRTLQQRLKKID